jgi:hypothetical protein
MVGAARCARRFAQLCCTGSSSSGRHVANWPWRCSRVVVVAAAAVVVMMILRTGRPPLEGKLRKRRALHPLKHLGPQCTPWSRDICKRCDVASAAVALLPSGWTMATAVVVCLPWVRACSPAPFPWSTCVACVVWVCSSVG